MPASGPIPGLPARAGALRGRRLDAVAALVLGIEMQVEVLLAPLSPDQRVTTQAALLLLALALGARRRLPLASFLAGTAVFVAVQAQDRVVTDHLFVPLFAVLFLNYSVAANAGGRRFWIAPPAALAAGLLSTFVDDYPDSVFDGLLWLGLVFVAFPMVAGRLIRNRSRLQRTLREKATRLDEERAARAEEAVLEERTRIAGELHDVVAHALGAMTVQASAARRLAETRPDQAREAFAAIEGDGREALAELRRLLGVLRHDDEELALAPQPSLRHLSGLARRTIASGLPVRLTVEGEPHDLPPGVDVTGYRIVQEALARARDEHHAGSATVVVRHGEDTVAVEVRDDGTGPATGETGMPGLRERVSLYGGDLQVRPQPGGGTLVAARLPTAVPA
jgi:signal transduction histidine kinase